MSGFFLDPQDGQIGVWGDEGDVEFEIGTLVDYIEQIAAALNGGGTAFGYRPALHASGTPGSEGAGAQQCVPATRRFHHRKVESWRRRGRFYLQRWPSKRAMGVLRDKIRAATDRRQVGRPLAAVVADLNPVLRGWSAYFRWGNSAGKFSTIDSYVHERLAIFDNRKRAIPGRSQATAPVPDPTERHFFPSHEPLCEKEGDNGDHDADPCAHQKAEIFLHEPHKCPCNQNRPTDIESDEDNMGVVVHGNSD
ncbi:group II intron maturase-specific domain-containing protein [Streptomyces sp. NPDC056231]|uniref:group II intron maturase-specific domain-containing protein n=1 Tax=Streptomyces sp. NPDC056231 TaxID=3345755 RepID=UPI003AAAC2D4